jgi:hypothetical protein
MIDLSPADKIRNIYEIKQVVNYSYTASFTKYAKTKIYSRAKYFFKYYKTVLINNEK